MSGISAIGSGGVSAAWRQAYYYMGMSRALRAAANPARVETPVEPVSPVKAVPSEVPVKVPVSVPEIPLPTEDALNNASENLARMRISYPDAEPVFRIGPQGQLINAEGGRTPELTGLQGMSAGSETAPSMNLPGAAKEEEKPVDAVDETKTAAEVFEETECQTCARRKYQDGSDDPGVSFKTPTAISPDAAPAAVRGHEQEHVVREQAKAEREGRHVVSQSVSIHTDICPECGRVYVSGGTTETVTAADKTNNSDVSRWEKKRGEGELTFGVAA